MIRDKIGARPVDELEKEPKRIAELVRACGDRVAVNFHGAMRISVPAKVAARDLITNAVAIKCCGPGTREIPVPVREAAE